jgi:hypothetical protein
MRSSSRASIVAAAMLAIASPARADDAGFRPHFVGDVRAMLLVRADDNYFQHADTFRYSIPREAGGVQLSIGAALTPRLSLLAEGFYVGDGADRGDARLRLSSGALLGIVRWAFLRWDLTDNGGWIDVSALAGFGDYFLRETFVDPGLSPQVFTKDDSTFGGVGGVEASIVISAFRGVIGYGYHVAPATVADRIRGSVYAGGHEISIGVGVRL